MVLQDIYYSGNKKIDDLIQEMHLKINGTNNVVFEWIPYNQFNDIKEIEKGDFATVNSATWEDGPLNYDTYYKEYKRNSISTKVTLKVLHNSQNLTIDFLQEVSNYNLFSSEQIVKCYGISQDLGTKNYMMVMNYMKDGNLKQYLKKNYIPHL